MSIIARAIDWAWGRPKPADISKAGYRTVIRYLSHDTSKNLTGAELAADLKSGLDVVVVWESTAGNATKGAIPGKADAMAAVQQLRALGAPTHGVRPLCVYLAVDRDVDPATVRPYFAAARAVLHAAGFRCGGYGSKRVVEDLQARKLTDLAWQTAAWSHGQVSGTARLYQNARTASVDGVTVDIDEIRSSDYGGWKGALARPKPAPKPAAKPAPRPAPKPAPKPAVKPAPKPPVKAAPKPASKPTPKPVAKPVAPAPTPVPTVQLDKADRSLLQRLLTLLTRLIAALTRKA